MDSQLEQQRADAKKALGKSQIKVQTWVQLEMKAVDLKIEEALKLAKEVKVGKEDKGKNNADKMKEVSDVKEKLRKLIDRVKKLEDLASKQSTSEIQQQDGSKAQSDAPKSEPAKPEKEEKADDQIMVDNQQVKAAGLGGAAQTAVQKDE